MQEHIITSLNSWMAQSPFFLKAMPRLGDVFVFTYPIFLIYLYFFHIRKSCHTNSTTKDIALSIFSTTAVGIIINYIIKAGVDQQRPFYTIPLPSLPQNDLLLSSIPTDAFPSDHASVGMCMAISTLIRGYRTHDKTLIIIGWLFLLFAFTMDIARITMGVHRPIDIIGGIMVGLVSGIIITHPRVHILLSKSLYSRIITIQEKMITKKA